MQTSSAASRRLRHYTNLPFETFIALFTLLPFFALAYFYSYLPERVPLFLNLGGEVEVWGKKTLLSVFRVPLMAVITQIICLLMKYGAVQSASLTNALRMPIEEQYLRLQVGLWDWFRFAVATKMSASSLDTIFLSLARFKFLSRPAFVITAVAALLGVAGALYYGYRLFVVRREIKARFLVAKAGKIVDKQHVYGGLLYFNPSDSALFVNKYIFNFANKWVWVFIASIIAYPLLILFPE